MRLFAAMLALILLAPGVLAGSLPMLVERARSDAAPLPDGCKLNGGTYACRWTYDTRGNGSDPTKSARAVYDLPTFTHTLANVKVTLTGVDDGWSIDLFRSIKTPLFSFNETLSSTRHQPQTGDLNPVIEEQTAHVFYTYGEGVSGEGPSRSEAHTFLLFRPYDPNARTAFNVGPTTTGESAGTFTIYYVAEPVPEGISPERPAATRGDPQLQGSAGDSTTNDTDLVAGWLDDPRLGDGLFSVHLAVAGGLDRIDWNHTDAPGFSEPTGQSSPTEKDWALHFKVQGAQYYVLWSTFKFSTGSGIQRSFFSCGLYRVTPEPAKAPTSTPRASRDALLAVPGCVVTNDTLNAEIPERSIGTPGPGVVFEELSANADDVISNAYRAPVRQDGLAPATFQFALGGPEVWDKLNGCRFCPPPPAPWYKDPFAAENVPNTVQVGGAAIAAGAFFVGLLLVRRRRVAVAKLLREVAEVEERHERDTRAALLALGQLDSRFADMFHKGKLTEGQYQTVAQRVATAATRFALRQGLGLDDGVAGDRQLGRSIPVQGDSAAPVRASHER